MVICNNRAYIIIDIYFFKLLFLQKNKKFKENNSNPKVRQLLGLNYEYPKIMDASKKINNIGLGYKAK